MVCKQCINTCKCTSTKCGDNCCCDKDCNCCCKNGPKEQCCANRNCC
ncbi:PREDICTED: metallothionein-2-like [Rhagoletis zephyria]|nr:PREDICTED: metallothionein-2-like [Rhagoletis zephyria]XP_036325381.1 metallothionein-2-like [Rhagoletis pomonella]